MSRDAAPARLHKQGYFGTRAKTIEGFEAIEKCLREKTPIVVTSVDFDGTATTTVHWHPDGPTGGVIASVGAGSDETLHVADLRRSAALSATTALHQSQTVQ